MERRPHARDPELLDALEAHAQRSFSERVWRVVPAGRNPQEPSRSGGRWDCGRFEVLYTSLDRDGALAEIDYHWRMQPVIPSKLRPELHELEVRASRAIYLESLDELRKLNVDIERYREPLYSRCQEIGDAAAFLGATVLIVPNARWPCLNAVLMLDVEPEQIEINHVASEAVDLHAWRQNNRTGQQGRRNWLAVGVGAPKRGPRSAAPFL